MGKIGSRKILKKEWEAQRKERFNERGTEDGEGGKKVGGR
jgi:hypothetical protein